MKKYIGFVLIMVLAVFALGRVASAEEDGGSATGIKPMSAELKSQIEAQRDALKQQIETQREAFKDAVEAKREAFKGVTGLSKEDMAAKREIFKTELAAKKKEFQAIIKADREAFKTKLEAEKAEFKANIKEKRGEFRGNAQKILGERFESAVKNITRLQERVQARIDALKAAGKDTVQAEVYLADSKTKLADAQAKLAELKALVPTTDEKITVENWTQIKDGANIVKGLIKEAHKSLVEAVKVLKGLGKVEKPESENETEGSGDSNDSN